jgi:DNA modification methylase
MKLVKINEVKPNPKNPRLIKDDKFKKLVKSIQEFPDMLNKRPLIVFTDVDGKYVVLGGNMRLKACKEIGLKEIPIILADEWTEEQKAEFLIKDNVGFGEWDWDSLANEWDAENLEDWGLDLPVDLSVKELEAEEDNFDVPEEGIETDIVLGDLFEIGEHRLLCGDSTCSDTVAKLMDGEKADMVFTDPPYGVAINNANGKILGDEDLQVFDECLPNIELFSKEDSHIYIYFGVQFISECVSKIKEYFKQTNILIQRITHENKPSPKGYFKNNYEVCYFSNKSGKDFNSGILEVSESTKNDSRYNGDGFLDTYLALNEIKSTEHNAKSIHPTQKTIEICSFYQKVSSKLNDIILDLFLGSGSTMVASHQLKRKCYGMELDPKYCQVILERMIKLDPTLKVKKNGEDYTLSV